MKKETRTRSEGVLAGKLMVSMLLVFGILWSFFTLMGLYPDNISQLGYFHCVIAFFGLIAIHATSDGGEYHLETDEEEKEDEDDDDE